MLDSLVRVSRRVGWVTDLLAANHDSASAGELPRSQRLLAGQPAATGPTRTTGDDKLAQRVLRSVSGGRHRSGLPTAGRSPWGLDGVTNFSCTARYNSRVPSPKGRAGHLHSRTQSRTFPIDPRPSRRSTGGGKCAPWRPRLRASSRNSPRRGPFTRRRRLRGLPETESHRFRASRAHPFYSKRFHVLLNSLFKVLFNFPSRYL